MAGKPKPMSQVKQMLRMRLKGKGIKTIARNLQISKNTVKEYIRKVETGNVPIAELLKLEDPILEAKLLAGNPSFKDDRYEPLKVRLKYFAKELKKVGVNRKVLYEEYCVDNANPYSYSQFCYHLQQYIKAVNLQWY
ncbi:LuxR C-terminal-related transcriptional regulator [Aequorivita marisscotiae]|uniref:LuxR C-terminal-related transcriptional regulator n=1 Tax=Aequorivita marisscotiae TaxID=3040348 RepID=A0ABY8KUF9_9FLAO|nr:LuxR C-terminal-related transcriptional regulator [Aequorivita sp. Ant34-E75]WGF92199.1 LuxR C-terminal-related transcriptional regulator [Aequorivita sp. Ant34-E75]